MTDSATSSASASTSTPSSTGSVSAPSSASSSSESASASATSTSPSSGVEGGSSQQASGSPSSPFDINQHLDAAVKLKINGAEKEYTLAKLMQEAQKFEAANERFNKAAEMEKMIAAREKLFKENPRQAMQELGIDPFEFSQLTLEEYLKESEKTPEQKELERLRKFEQDQLSAKEQQEQARKQQEFDAILQGKQQELDTIIPEMIEKHGLIKDISSAQRIADVMLDAIEVGVDLTYEMAARLVKKEQEDYFKSMTSRMAPEQLYSYLGEEGFKKMSEYSLAKVKQPQAQQPAPTQQQTPFKAQGDKKESLAEYNRRLRQELGL